MLAGQGEERGCMEGGMGGRAAEEEGGGRMRGGEAQ